MHHVYLSTVLRKSKDKRATGYLYKLLWPKGTVVREIPIPALTRTVDFWNSRGGNRGGRGIAIHNDHLYVATAINIIQYDKSFRFVKEISNPKFCGLHELFIEDDGIWVTSTIHDLIIKVDFDGNTLFEWLGSESKLLQKTFKFGGRKLNLELDFPEEEYAKRYGKYVKGERLHLNTVQVFDGKVYAFSCSKRALIKIHPKPERIVMRDSSLVAPHNCFFIGKNRIIANNTRMQTINLYDKKGKRVKTIHTRVHTNKGRSFQFAKEGWQRGLTHMNGKKYLIGTSPVTVFQVDISKGIIERVVPLSDDVRHCVHGLAYD